MSKAFTKEDSGEEEPLPPYALPWPAGARNYVTPAGYARLLAEREEVATRVPIPGADAKSAAREAQRRLAMLNAHLEAAEVVASGTSAERVQFATTVRVRGADDRLRSYSIVGVDEADVARGKVSWLSPIARALQGARVGDLVTLRSPRGEEELEVVEIAPL